MPELIDNKVIVNGEEFTLEDKDKALVLAIQNLSSEIRAVRLSK